jgi:hypothetical protein
MDRYLGDWMENEYIKPTKEEVMDLYLVVEATPYEFDYTCEDILEKAELRGVSSMYVKLMLIKAHEEMVS